MKNLSNILKFNQFSLNSIIYNKFLLYFFLFVSFINMTSYGLMGDIKTPLVFILIGVITSYYNKNMLVILVISLTFSNIIKYGSKMSTEYEGFTEGMDASGNKTTTTPTTTTTDTSSNTDDNDESNVLNPENETKLKEIKEMKDKITELISKLQTNMNIANSKLEDLQNKVKIKHENFINKKK